MRWCGELIVNNQPAHVVNLKKSIAIFEWQNEFLVQLVYPRLVFWNIFKCCEHNFYRPVEKCPSESTKIVNHKINEDLPVIIILFLVRLDGKDNVSIVLVLDFVGPFWVCATLVFTTAITGNLASYLSNLGNHEWVYDFHKGSLNLPSAEEEYTSNICHQICKSLIDSH